MIFRLVFSIILAAFAVTAAAQENPTKSLTLHLSTGYVDGLGSVTIWPTGDSHRVSWDANACSLDKWGVPSGCTRMAVWSFNVDLVVDERVGSVTRLNIVEDGNSGRLEGWAIVLDRSSQPTRATLVREVQRGGGQNHHANPLFPTF